MNIRAHHLLCTRYFRGKGYSKKFVSNFYKVIEKLKDNPVIKIVNYPDAICSPCPHNSDGKCIKKGPDFEGEVKTKDNIVMRHLGIKLNTEMKSTNVNNLVDLKLGELKELCKDCEWRKYCNQGN